MVHCLTESFQSAEGALRETIFSPSSQTLCTKNMCNGVLKSPRTSTEMHANQMQVSLYATPTIVWNKNLFLLWDGFNHIYCLVSWEVCDVEELLSGEGCEMGLLWNCCCSCSSSYACQQVVAASRVSRGNIFFWFCGLVLYPSFQLL